MKIVFNNSGAQHCTCFTVDHTGPLHDKLSGAANKAIFLQIVIMQVVVV